MQVEENRAGVAAVNIFRGNAAKLNRPDLEPRLYGEIISEAVNASTKIFD